MMKVDLDGAAANIKRFINERNKDARFMVDEFVRNLKRLEAENEKLRRILAHVPGRIVIKAKEDAGFPDFVVAK